MHKHASSPTDEFAMDEQTDHPPVYRKDELFAGAREIHIDHRGLRYRLKETRNGKLILNL